MDPMNRSRAGFTAVEMLVVVVVVGIAAAVTIPAILRSGRNQQLVRCENNLRALYKAEAEARAKGKLPTATGNAYWAALVKKSELLTCPLSGAAYRGPAADPSRLPPGAPIGGDAPGSHGAGEGGYFLLKSGEVRAFRERDPHWPEGARYRAP